MRREISEITINFTITQQSIYYRCYTQKIAYILGWQNQITY